MNRTVVALGMFDGVHLGHQVLLKRAAETAHAQGDEAVVFTYSNHPKELFSGAFQYVSTLEQREKLILACGCDRVDAIPFDAAFASMMPEAFPDWLSARYGHRISTIVVGYDYRFGCRAAGDAALLKELSEARGIDVIVVGEVDYRDLPCASTRVREAIRAGDMGEAEAMLGEFCGDNLVKKLRYTFPAAAGLQWEIDEYLELNAGLFTAEIELPEPGTPFPRPPWLGEEISGDPRYTNAALSCRPWSLWKEEK